MTSKQFGTTQKSILLFIFLVVQFFLNISQSKKRVLDLSNFDFREIRMAQFFQLLEFI